MSACCWFSFEVELVKCLIMSQSNTSIVLQSMPWLQKRQKMYLVVLIMEYYSSGDIQIRKLANPVIPPRCNLTLITTTTYWNTCTVSGSMKIYLANNKREEISNKINLKSWQKKKKSLKCPQPSHRRSFVFKALHKNNLVDSTLQGNFPVGGTIKEFWLNRCISYPFSPLLWPWKSC